MALTINHPHSRRGRSGATATRPGEVTLSAPSAVGIVGFTMLLLGAWAGIVAYVGPEFGYQPTTASSWQWTTSNWLLHLLPGAVAVVAGLSMLAMAPRRRAVARAPFGLAGLLSVAAGAWLVLGPAVWPLFESSSPYGSSSGATMTFLHQLGTNLGPGVLLAVLGGMALKSLARDRSVVLAEAGPAASAPAASAPAASDDAPRRA